MTVLFSVANSSYKTFSSLFCIVCLYETVTILIDKVDARTVGRLQNVERLRQKIAFRQDNLHQVKQVSVSFNAFLIEK